VSVPAPGPNRVQEDTRPMPAPSASDGERAALDAGRPAEPVGALLRRYRLRAGLSQEALAERAGLSPAAIGALEQGQRRRPHPQTVTGLADALELTPGEREALLEAAGRPSGAGSPPTAVPPLAVRPLPAPPTALIGRETEVREATALLRQSDSPVRLLTLTGPGGVGKTRLALAVAAATVDTYPDGVTFVDLAPLRDHRLVPATVARALGLEEMGGASARELLLRHLAQRRLLLVLDNLEHLPGAVPWLAELLEGCPHLAVLATSRAALRMRAERRFPVAPLAVPLAADDLSLEAVAASPAVQLFAERAQAAAPELALDAGNAGVVAGICRRLDGMPLALELAAARVRLLSAATLLRRLERRLPLLTGGARDLPERQRTLRTALSWSHDLLAPAERVLLRRLAAFAGGCTLEAAEAVCADDDLPVDDVLERFQALVDNSLVQRTTGAGDEPRFGMLETIREYAAEQLSVSGELERVRARHRDWYAAWAERVQPELTGPDQLVWYGRLTDELENFRVAREWCQRGPDGAGAGLRLAAALGRFFEVRLPSHEGRRWLAEALATGPPEPSAELARALTWCGQLEHRHGEAEAGRARLAEAVAVARRVGDRSLLCLTLRHLALYIADRAAAPALLEEAAALARAAGDRRELALALCFLGIARRQGGDDGAAGVLSGAGGAAARASGDLTALTPALFTLGDLKIARGEYEMARALLDEALELSQLLDHRGYMATINRRLAQLALARGEPDAARGHVRASLEMARASSIGALGLQSLQLASRLAGALGDHPRAVRLRAAVAGWQGDHAAWPGSTVWAGWTWTSRDDDETLRAAHTALGESAFAAAWAEGSLLSLDDALDVALTTVGPEHDLAPPGR
jgi:predicted ATPase/transcriptional regulator with XRE-family HTH domain